MTVVSLRKIMDGSGFVWIIRSRDPDFIRMVLMGIGPASIGSMLPPETAQRLKEKGECIVVKTEGGLNRELVPTVVLWKPYACSKTEFFEDVEMLLEEAKEHRAEVHITAEERILLSGAVRSDENGVFIEIARGNALRAVTNEGRIYTSLYVEYDSNNEIKRAVLKHPKLGIREAKWRSGAAKLGVWVLGSVDKNASLFASMLFNLADRLRMSTAKRFVAEGWFYDERGYLSPRHRGALFDIDFY